jgi:hypothetical protein
MKPRLRERKKKKDWDAGDTPLLIILSNQVSIKPYFFLTPQEPLTLTTKTNYQV